MSSVYETAVEFLTVELFRRAVGLVESRFPGQNADPIAAHVKIYCTGESENERSLAASTPTDRKLAREMAAEIMASDVSGLYGLDAESFYETVSGLPEDGPSFKRIALCYDQLVAIHILTLATDLSTLPPTINREFVIREALPRLKNAQDHDSRSAVLRTTIAQTYYTLGDIEAGFGRAQEALALDADNPEAWRLVGNGHMAMGDDAAARNCYTIALELNPNIDGVRQALSLLS